MMRHNRRPIWRLALTVVLCFVLSESISAEESDIQTWPTVQIDEVLVRIPPDWERVEDPGEGVLALFRPKIEKKEAQLYYTKAPSPKGLNLSPQLEEHYLWGFTVTARRMNERKGLIAMLRSQEILTIKGLKCLRIVFAIGDAVSQKGSLITMVFLTKTHYHCFSGYGYGDDWERKRALFNSIFHSVEIGEPTRSAEPMTIEQTIDRLEPQLKDAFQGMPHGWEWELIKIAPKSENQSRDLLVVMKLGRDDAMDLAHDSAIAFKALKADREPEPEEFHVELITLQYFMQQIGMFNGLVASAFLVEGAPPISRICPVVTSPEGTSCELCCMDVGLFSQALSTNNPKDMFNAMICEE